MWLHLNILYLVENNYTKLSVSGSRLLNKDINVNVETEQTKNVSP